MSGPAGSTSTHHDVLERFDGGAVALQNALQRHLVCVAVLRQCVLGDGTTAASPSGSGRASGRCAVSVCCCLA